MQGVSENSLVQDFFIEQITQDIKRQLDRKCIGRLLDKV